MIVQLRAHGRKSLWPRVSCGAARRRRSRRQSGTRRRKAARRPRRSGAPSPPTRRHTASKARRASAVLLRPPPIGRGAGMLSERERSFLAARKVGYLATADRAAKPHVVPVCFSVADSSLYITIEEKPKRRAESKLKREQSVEQNAEDMYFTAHY